MVVDEVEVDVGQTLVVGAHGVVQLTFELVNGLFQKQNLKVHKQKLVMVRKHA